MRTSVRAPYRLVGVDDHIGHNRRFSPHLRRYSRVGAAIGRPRGVALITHHPGRMRTICRVRICIGVMVSFVPAAGERCRTVRWTVLCFIPQLRRLCRRNWDPHPSPLHTDTYLRQYAPSPLHTDTYLRRYAATAKYDPARVRDLYARQQRGCLVCETAPLGDQDGFSSPTISWKRSQRRWVLVGTRRFLAASSSV